MFDAYIAYHARLTPAAPAIRTSDGAVSFARLDADVTRAAGLLSSLEADAARPVAMDIRDIYLIWLVTLALARLGLPSAPGGDGACTLSVSDRADREPTLVLGKQAIDAILSGPVPVLPAVDVDPRALGRIMLSSGTTGTQKRIPLSWAMIDAGIRNVPIAYGTAPGPWLMATGPQTILGFVLTLGCWALGQPVLMPDRSPDAALLGAMRPGLIATTPSQLASLLDGMPAGSGRLPMRVVTGGGAVPPKLVERTRRLLTDDLLSVYGASECGAVAVAGPALLERVPSAAGIVLPGVTVEIVDDSGARVAAGEPGHVRLRSNRTADGYLGGEASAFRNGWFWPGDFGRLDARGLLRLDGRSDDLMNLGGDKIQPAWIEAPLQGLSGVREVAAFAAADADGVERCWVAIAGDDTFGEPQLAAALSYRLAATGPINWLRVAQLPRNAMGKIQRDVLRDLVMTRSDLGG